MFPSCTWTSQCQSTRTSMSGRPIHLNTNPFLNSKIPLMSQARVLMHTTMQEDYCQLQGDTKEWFHTVWKNLMDSQTKSTITVSYSWEFHQDFSQTILPAAQYPIVRSVARGITIFGKTFMNWQKCVERRSKITHSSFQFRQWNNQQRRCKCYNVSVANAWCPCS